MAYETAPVRGVEVHYGVRTTNGKFGGSYGTKGGVTEAVYVYDVTDVPTAGDDHLTLDLPAYAKVTKITTELIEVVTQGGDRTGFTVDTVIGDFAGAAEEMGGFTRGLAVVDAVTVPTSVGATAAELAVTLTPTGGTTGALTAGKLRTIVEYIPEGV